MKVSLIFSLFVFLTSIIGCLQSIESSSNLITQNTNKSVIEKTFLPESKPLPKLENPRIVVKKSQRKLELFDGEKPIKTYKVALGFAPGGDKEKEGDGKTPEGDFYIFAKNERSKFYLSLGISYPNIENAERGLKAKLITKAERDNIVRAIINGKSPFKIRRSAAKFIFTAAEARKIGLGAAWL